MIPTSGRNAHRGGGTSNVTCEFRVIDATNPMGPGLETGNTHALPVGTQMWRNCYNTTTRARISGPTLVSSTAGAAGAPNVTAQLVDQALANIDIDLPTPTFSPPGQTLPNIDTWFWTDQPSTQTASATAAGVTVTVSATITTTRYDLGDDTILTCPGAPKPYDTTKPESAQSTTCKHRFTAPTRDLTIDTTTTWHLRWTATNGTSGDLGTIDRTTSTPYRVQAKETVIRS